MNCPSRHSGYRLADRPRLVANLFVTVHILVRQTRRRRRRQFRAAVAFVRQHAEAFLEVQGQRHRQLLGSRDEDAHRAKIVLVTLLQAEAQESRRRQEDGAFQRAAQLADLAGRARVGVVDGGGADLQRRPQRDRVAKTVEKRQHAEHPVGLGQPCRLDHRLDIGRDVAVRQHHALRLAGTAAGEDDRCQILDRMAPQTERDALQPPAGQQNHFEKRP